MERFWHRKAEILGEKAVLMPHCPPQISHWLALDRAIVSMTRGHQLAAWGSEVKKKSEKTFLSNTPRFPKKRFYLKFPRLRLFVLLARVADNIDGAFVEWCWRGKSEVLAEKPDTVLLCPPHISHGLVWVYLRPPGWEVAINCLSHDAAGEVWNSCK